MEDQAVRLAMVSLGGVLGTSARYLVGLWANERIGPAFPYGTLIVNVTGSFAIGFFLTLVGERVPAHPYWRLFFAVGFLGAYTTFSSYTWESAQLLAAGDVVGGLANLVGSVALGMLAVVLGIILARQF